MSATIRGQQTLIEGVSVSTWKIATGGNTVRNFTGTQTDVVNKALELQAQGYETEITSGPVYKLKATVTYDTNTNPGNTEPEPEPIWELVSTPKDVDLLECDDLTIIKKLSTATKEAIRTRVREQDSVIPILGADQLDNTYASVLPYAERTYALMQSGLEARHTFDLALKRSIIVSRNYNLNWSITYSNWVLSTTRIIALYNVPVVLRSLLPSSNWSKVYINTPTPDTAGTNYLDFFGGWLEQHPNYRTVANNKVEISQEWIYKERWSAGTERGIYPILQ